MCDENRRRKTLRTPIKLNKAYWPELLTTFLPSADDPRILTRRGIDAVSFSKAVSILKFGTTFKKTEKNRYPLTLHYLSTIVFPVPPVILDIGASDGVTSLDVIEKIPFCKYYITDLYLKVFYEFTRTGCHFYDDSNKCILIVTDKWVIYSDTKDAVFPFGHITKYVYSKLSPIPTFTGELRLINPALSNVENAENIFIKKYNVFDIWTYEKADLIIVANILNNFSDTDRVKALSNIFAALNNPGRLVIVENKAVEKATAFHILNNQITVEKDIHGGTEIKEFVVTVYHTA